MSMLCRDVRKPQFLSRELCVAISVPLSAAGSPGVFLFQPCISPRARFPPSVPSSLLGPCQRPWCQGRRDTTPVSLNGAKRDREGTRSYLTHAPVTLLLPHLWMIPLCWEDHFGVGCAAGMCLTLLRPHQAHASVLHTTKQDPQTKTTPHFCILSCVWKQLKQIHHGLGFQQE